MAARSAPRRQVIASRSISWRGLPRELRATHGQRFARFRKAGNLGTDFERVCRMWAVQKLIVERSAITHAFCRKASPGLRTPPPGRMMYCTSG
jgi:hypothetical protein